MQSSSPRSTTNPHREDVNKRKLFPFFKYIKKNLLAQKRMPQQLFLSILSCHSQVKFFTKYYSDVIILYLNILDFDHWFHFRGQKNVKHSHWRVFLERYFGHISPVIYNLSKHAPVSIRTGNILYEKFLGKPSGSKKANPCGEILHYPRPDVSMKAQI